MRIYIYVAAKNLWQLIFPAAVLLSGTLFSQDIESFKGQKPFKISGSLSLSGDYYAVQGIAPRSVPFNWRLTGTPTISIYGMSFPFYFNLGTQNRSFAQPFNQFGVSPRYKWITIHAGWRSLSYSQYTLSGLMFLGGGLELNPGKFRFSAMYGRFTRMVREDVAQQFITPIPAFRRVGFAAKIGVGTPTNYVDFIFFKAKDDKSSYPNAPERLKPQENAVLGITSRLLLFKHLQLSFDGAASGYTRCTWLYIPEDKIYQTIRPVLYTNISTQLLLAGNVSAGFVSKHFNSQFRYRRVGQDYKSMGAYIYETDLEAFTVEPSFNILKNKIRVGGSFGVQRDNLLNVKLITTSRKIGSLNISWNPNRIYGLDLHYGNYGIAQRAGISALNDTTRLALTNQNINLVNRLSFINKSRVLTVVLMGVYQEMRNLNPISPALIQSVVWLGNLNVNYTFLSTKTSLIGGFNYSRNSFALGDITLLGPTLGFGKAIFKDKLNITASSGFMLNTFGGGADKGLTINGSTNLTYRVNKNNSFIVSVRLIRNTASNPLSVPFSEGFFTAGYQLVFY